MESPCDSAAAIGQRLLLESGRGWLSRVNCLLCKQEVLSSDPQHQCKKTNMTELRCNPSTGGYRTDGKGAMASQTSLTDVFWVQRETLFQNRMWRTFEESTQCCPLASICSYTDEHTCALPHIHTQTYMHTLHTCTPCTHMYTCTYTYTCIYIHTCSYACTYAHVYIYLYMYAHTSTHTHTKMPWSCMPFFPLQAGKEFWSGSWASPLILLSLSFSFCKKLVNIAATSSRLLEGWL